MKKILSLQTLKNNVRMSWKDPNGSMGDHFQSDVDFEENIDVQSLKGEVDNFTSSQLIHADDIQLVNGVTKFLRRYNSLSGYKSTARSAFHQFGWIYGGAVLHASTKGTIRHGKRIAVQATAAGRRCGKNSRGKSRIPAGRSCTNTFSLSDVHSMPTRNKPKGKRLHSLQEIISKGLQNAGKWWWQCTTSFNYIALSFFQLFMKKNYDDKNIRWPNLFFFWILMWMRTHAHVCATAAGRRCSKNSHGKSRVPLEDCALILGLPKSDVQLVWQKQTNKQYMNSDGGGDEVIVCGGVCVCFLRISTWVLV